MGSASLSQLFEDATGWHACSGASKRNILNAHLIPMMGDKPLDQLTPLDLQALKSKLKGRKPKTLSNVLTVLSKLLKVAVEFEVIDIVPINAKGKKADAPEMQFYEFGEYAKLVEAAESISTQHLLVVLLGGDAGPRRGRCWPLSAKTSTSNAE
jgi:Phage integrase, N-terminal SAM-like domain